MTFPAFLYGTLIALLLGSAFHLWKGGPFGKIILYNIVSFLGFWTGHFIGEMTNFSLWVAGPISMGTAIIGSIILLFIGHWLSLTDREK
jgi:amino acid permease